MYETFIYSGSCTYGTFMLDPIPFIQDPVPTEHTFIYSGSCTPEHIFIQDPVLNKFHCWSASPSPLPQAKLQGESDL
jgi:hypothetical protein